MSNNEFSGGGGSCPITPSNFPHFDVNAKQTRDPSAPRAGIPLSYDIGVVPTVGVNNGIEYSIKNAYAPPTGVTPDSYGSFTITFPKELTVKLPPGTPSYLSGWKITTSDQTISFTRNASGSKNNISPANLQTYLNSIRFQIKDENIFPPGLTSVSVSANIAVLSSMFIDDRQHYYEFVNTGMINWGAAYTQAKTREYLGLRGYLCTIEGPAEQQFIWNSVAALGGWLGGTRATLKATNQRILDLETVPTAESGYTFPYTTNKDWYWADGPNAGLVYYTAPTGMPPLGNVPGVYNNWNISGGPSDKQPDGDGGSAAWMQFGYTGNDAWNDLPFVNVGNISGYYVEYGGYTNEVELPFDTGGNNLFPQPVYVTWEDGSGNIIHGPILAAIGEYGDTYNVQSLADDVTPPPDYIWVVKTTGSRSGTTGTFTDEKQTVVFSLFYTKVMATLYPNYPGGQPVDHQLTYDEPYGPLPTPSRIGWQFIRWTRNPDGTDPVDLDEIVVERDSQDMYANWLFLGCPTGYHQSTATGNCLDDDLGAIGPAGPTGPTGPIGPAGPAGDSGVMSDRDLTRLILRILSSLGVKICCNRTSTLTGRRRLRPINKRIPSDNKPHN